MFIIIFWNWELWIFQFIWSTTCQHSTILLLEYFILIAKLKCSEIYLGLCILRNNKVSFLQTCIQRKIRDKFCVFLTSVKFRQGLSWSKSMGISRQVTIYAPCGKSKTVDFMLQFTRRWKLDHGNKKNLCSLMTLASDFGLLVNTWYSLSSGLHQI